MLFRSYNGTGVEADLTLRPARSTAISLGGAWNNATYGDFVTDVRGGPGLTVNLRGNRAVLSPELSAFIRADTAIPLSSELDVRIAGDFTWRGRQFFTIYNDPRETQRAYGLAGGSIGIASSDGRYSVALVGQNLFNSNYLTYAVEQGFGVVTARGRPRTLSVELRLAF